MIRKYKYAYNKEGKLVFFSSKAQEAFDKAWSVEGGEIRFNGKGVMTIIIP